MAEKVQVFITHYETQKPYIWNAFVRRDNVLLQNTIKSIKQNTRYENYEIVVVENHDTDEDLERLERSLPPDVKILHNDGGKSYQQAVNKIHLTAETEHFVVLHSDVRVPRGWLSNLTTEILNAEEQFDSPCLLSPDYVDYVVYPEDREHPLFQFLHETGRPLLPEMKKYCVKHRIPFKDGEVCCRPAYKGPIGLEGTMVTDSGNTIMMYITSKDWHEVGGLFDERMIGMDFTDGDWGITALMNGAKSLVSHTVFFMHVGGGTSIPPPFTAKNVVTFEQKWGKEVLNKWLNGSIWPELHKKQRGLGER